MFLSLVVAQIQWHTRWREFSTICRRFRTNTLKINRYISKSNQKNWKTPYAFRFGGFGNIQCERKIDYSNTGSRNSIILILKMKLIYLRFKFRCFRSHIEFFWAIWASIMFWEQRKPESEWRCLLKSIKPSFLIFYY